MKRIFIFSLLLSILLASCKFRTPKSEKDAQENQIVENGDTIVVGVPSIVFNNFSVDKDNYLIDTAVRSTMSQKYLELYTASFGNTYKVFNTKCTTLQFLNDSLKENQAAVAIGTRSSRLVVYIPGKTPLFYDTMPEVNDLSVQLMALESGKISSPKEKLILDEQDKQKMLKEESLKKEIEIKESK